MANQIQGTVYQIDGSPLSAPIQVAFLTSNILIRQFTTPLIPQVNAQITYYPNTSNQLQEQTFLVSETIATLVSAANTNGTTQVSGTVLEINQEPQLPSGITFSFPAQGISIWPIANPIAGRPHSYLEFKNKKYYLLEDEATLVSAANAGGGGGGGTTINPTNNFMPFRIDGSTFGDSYWFVDTTTKVMQTKYLGSFTGLYFDFLNYSYQFGGGGDHIVISSDSIISIVGSNTKGFSINSINQTFGDTQSLYLQFDQSFNQFRFYYNGYINGLLFDFLNNQYKFGDFNNYNNKTQINIDDLNQFISMSGGASATQGLLLDFVSNAFYLGSYCQFLVEDNNFNAKITVDGDANAMFTQYNQVIGDVNNNYNGNKLVLNHDLANLTNYIEASSNGIQNGFFIDFYNSHYKFGDFSNGSFIDFDNLTQTCTIFSTNILIDNGLAAGFSALNSITTIGDFDNYQNSTVLGVDDSNEFLFASTNLLSGTATSPSGQYLKINIGGTDYRIELKNP